MSASAKDARAEQLSARNLATNSKRGLVELAAESGYTPGEFSMERLAADIARAREWMGYLAIDKTPPEFGRLKPHEARGVVRELLDDIEDRDQRWRDYFYPKLRSVESEVSGPDGAPVLTVSFVKPDT